MTRRQLHRAGPLRQRGLAGVLLVIFIGMGLIVLAVGVVRTVRSTQERTIAVHAKTPAQASGWYGVETIRRYLDEVEPPTVRAWNDAGTIDADHPMQLTLGSDDPLNFTASITSVAKIDPDPTDQDYRITALIEGSAGTGAVTATAPIEVVYEMTLRNDPPPTVPNGPPTYDFFRDLEISGDVEFQDPEHAVINVQGNVTIETTNFSGAGEVNATGDVNINSAVNMESIWANGDVNLMEGADSDVVRARGDVLLSGGGIHGQIRSNENVRFESSEAQLVEVTKDLTVGVDGESCRNPRVSNRDGTYIATAKVKGEVRWFSCGGGAKDLTGNKSVRYHGATRYHTGSNGTDDYSNEQILRAIEDIDLRSAERVGKFIALRDLRHDFQSHHPVPDPAGGNVPFVRFCAVRNMEVVWKNWTRYQGTALTEGWYGGTLRYPSATATSEPICNPSTHFWECPPLELKPLPAPAGKCDFAAVQPVVVEPVPEYTITPPRIDARVLKPDAHLAFEHDADGNVKVTAKNLQGVPNGAYTLGYELSGSTKYPDQLCKLDKIDMTGAPDLGTGQRRCTQPVKKICENNGNVSCFAYQPDADGAGGTWTIGRPAGDTSDAGDTIARGFIWVEGDLVVGRTAFVGAFLATGDIRFEAFNRVLSANYAGHGRLCANERIPNASNGHVTSPDLAGLYPKNLCNDDGTVVYTRLGNVSAIAGSFDGGVFTGGNISTVGQVRLDGSVLAGNQIETSGHTTINGHLVGAGQGDPRAPGAASGDLGETTDLIYDPQGIFNPNDDPCMTGACEENNGAAVRWARYL
jgi:hypothetical protein